MEKNQEQSNIPQNEVEAYEKPACEIIEMEYEGILCGSGDQLPQIPGHSW